MYIFKNAMRNIGRSKGRNILIGIIVLVIAGSSCIALSIRQAANEAREQSLSGLSITAQISVDRSAMMKNMQPSSDAASASGGFDKDSFRNKLVSADALTLDQLQTYATAASVKDFTYTLTASLNGSDGCEPVTTTASSDSSGADATGDTLQAAPDMGGRGGEAGGMGGGFDKGTMGTQGDFTVVGYNSDAAMTDFLSGTCAVTDGSMFDEGTSEMVCILSDELAAYNGLSVGSTITLQNPNLATETYTLTIVGLYHNDQSAVSTGGKMGGFSTASDPANQIYTSYATLKAIGDSSAAAASSSTDATTGRETTTALPTQLAGTYAFASVDDYEAFDAEARALGLSDDYTVSSSDLTAFEQSMTPLNNLSTFALYFLIIVFLIGAIILIVLNIFSIRERKYEIGVLTAIGMKKSKVCLQFLTEILTVTLIAIVIGAGIGTAASVPVTNALLQTQVSAQQQSAQSQQQAFGRPSGDTQNGAPAELPSGQADGTGHAFGGTQSYITQVSSATNWVVILQLFGIGLLLSLLAGIVSMIFILRYEPLKILSNRD